MARKVTAGHMALRNTEHNPRTPNFTHDVIAVDSDGDFVFATEALHSHEVENALDDYPEGDDAPEGVDHYKIRER